jgi:hypothetical protein
MIVSVELKTVDKVRMTVLRVGGLIIATCRKTSIKERKVGGYLDVGGELSVCMVLEETSIIRSKLDSLEYGGCSGRLIVAVYWRG